MKKSGICLFALLLIIKPLFAANTDSVDNDFTAQNETLLEEQLPTVFPTDEFYNASDELVNIQEIVRPNCDTPQLYNKILETIKSYMQSKENSSILVKRKHTLTWARLQDFDEVSATDFSPNDDANTANTLIMLKINQKIKNDDILICKQKNAAILPIYVIVVPYLDNFKGYIINLDSHVTSNEISFIYP